MIVSNLIFFWYFTPYAEKHGKPVEQLVLAKEVSYLIRFIITLSNNFFWLTAASTKLLSVAHHLF